MVFTVYDLVGMQPLRVVRETCTVGIAKIAAVLKSGVNFTNILQAAFTPADPKRAKKDSQVKQLFALLGSARVKAVRKHIDEIDCCNLYDEV